LSRGVPLGEVLRERGLVQPFELYRLLQQNLAKKLLDGFSWRDGEFALRDEAPEVGSPLKVRVPQLVVTGITRFAPGDEVEAAMSPLRQSGMTLASAPPFSVDEIRLSPAQRHLLNLVGQGWQVTELAAAAQVGEQEIDRLLYALALLGVVVPGRQPASAPTPSDQPAAAPAPAPPVAPEPAPPLRPAPAGAAAPPDAPTPPDVEGLRNQVMQAYLSYRRQDAFELLGLGDGASLSEVDDALLAYAERFAPWRYRGEGLDAVAEKARDLFLAGVAAHAELRDSERRNALIHRRQSALDRRAEGTTASLRIETDLLDSEKQFEKGLRLMEAGKHEQALTLLEFASDCDPQNVLYRAEAANCRFLAEPGSTAAARRALGELTDALRIDPRFGLAVYYAGLIHQHLGDLGTAESMLRRANQLMAPDRRPIEALKELKAGRRKR
jgi:hypothetical protein